MTYYGRTTDQHVDLHLALVVEGIPVAFVERNVTGTPTAYGGRTAIVCMTRVEEGESTLDYGERRENASTLDVELLDTDSVLAALFAAGTRAAAWVSTDDANTAADTTVYVNTDAPFTAGDHVYVGAETMTITTVDPAPFLDVTRGAFGSTAADGMTGTASDGDAIYTVPPYWRGRRAWLYGFAPDGAGLYTETLLGTYIIDEAPRHAGDLRWSIRLAGIVQEYWERSVGVGMREATILDLVGASPFLPAYDLTTTPPSAEFRIDDKLALQTPAASWPAYVMLTRPDGVVSIHELTAHDDATGDATVRLHPDFGTEPLISVYDLAGGKCRQIGVIQAPGSASILIALLSTTGQALSGGDYLPGRDPSTTHDPGWRLGAGFLSTEVDTAAFDGITAIPSMTLIIDGERKVTDLLREWCILTGTAIVSTVDGKIKPITLAAQRTANTRTIGADDVIPDGPVSVEHDEAGVFPLLTVRAGYSPITGDFHDEINLIDVDLAKRYRRTPARREVELRSVDAWSFRLRHLDNGGWRHPTRYQPGALVSLLSDAMRGDGALARRFVSLSLTHEHLDLRLGDLVTIGTDLPDAYDLPDFRGSTIVGATCRIVGRRPRYDQARVDVRLEVLDRLLFVAPAATIASAVTDSPSPGLTTLTLSAAGPEVSGASPAEDFYTGAVVTVVDRSNPAATEAATVQSTPSGVTLVIDSVAFTIQNGVDYVTLSPEASADGTTVSGYSRVEIAKLANDAGVAGSVETINPRWR